MKHEGYFYLYLSLNYRTLTINQIMRKLKQLEKEMGIQAEEITPEAARSYYWMHGTKKARNVAVTAAKVYQRFLKEGLYYEPNF